MNSAAAIAIAAIVAVAAVGGAAVLLMNDGGNPADPVTTPNDGSDGNGSSDGSGSTSTTVSNTVTITGETSKLYDGSAAIEPTYTVLGEASSTFTWLDSAGTTEISAPVDAGTYMFRITTGATSEYSATTQYFTYIIYEKMTSDYSITCVSGTADAYTVTDDGYGGVTITFTTVTENSEYQISGTVYGNIVIDIGDDFEFTLDLSGLTLTSVCNVPIEVVSADEVSISAQKKTTSNIYDKRAVVTDEDEQHAAAIYSVCDLKLKGKGTLNVISDNNNGIRTKDDLSVKNLTLTVNCEDNALKGNDSVTIESGTITLIARTGDGIKTSNTATKYNDDGTFKKQQGNIYINTDEGDLTLNIYAACDGIDASYDVVISGSPVINIYTSSYSSYSEEVESSTSSTIYLAVPSTGYYSVLFSDETWANTSYVGSAMSGRTTYQVYSFDMPSSATTVSVYKYSSSSSQGTDSGYSYCSGVKTVNTAKNCIILKTNGSTYSFDWTTYGQQPTGPGGQSEGNSDKLDYSAKGIKADNSVTISGGTVTVESYDDCIHANSDVEIDYGNGTTAYGAGDVTISGGVLTLFSCDDAAHADGTLTVSGGEITVTGCYEGLEGTYITISGGVISVTASDDGINGTSESGTAIAISGGDIYIYAQGDGIDSNSRTSKTGLVISGGDVVVICNSTGNGAIDTENGYTVSGSAHVVAVMSSSSQWKSETTNVTTSLGTSTKTIGLTKDNYLTVNGDDLVVKMPCSFSSAYVFCIGWTSSTVSSSTNAGVEMTKETYWSV